MFKSQRQGERRNTEPELGVRDPKELLVVGIGSGPTPGRLRGRPVRGAGGVVSGAEGGGWILLPGGGNAGGRRQRGRIVVLK